MVRSRCPGFDPGSREIRWPSVGCCSQIVELCAYQDSPIDLSQAAHNEVSRWRLIVDPMLPRRSLCTDILMVTSRVPQDFWAGPLPYIRTVPSVRNGFPALWKQAEKLNPILVEDRCMPI